MAINYKKIAILFSLCAVTAYAEVNEEAGISADQRYLYLGIDGGITEPVIRKFRHERSGSDFVLKGSEMFSVKVGYSFYPQIAIGVIATYQPKYRLHYTLPAQTLSSGAIIPETPGNTKVLTNAYMVNMTYDLAQVKGITPSVILAVGLAQVQIKPTSSKWDAINADYFRINKNNNNCFAWQMGVGLSKDLTSNISLNMTAKLQTAYDIKIKYETLDITTQSFVPATPIKKTIGVGEFTIGLTYKLPI